MASICHGRAHQSCVHSLARCVLCARVCERALSQVRQQVRGSTRDHRHSPSQHQHTTTQNSAAATGTQPLAPTCLVSHTACRLSRSTSLHRRGLGLGPKAVAGQRGTTPQRAASRRRARVKKKRTKLSFFSLHIVTGNDSLWQVSEAPKYFGGGAKKNQIFPPPPHPPYQPSLPLAVDLADD